MSVTNCDPVLRPVSVPCLGGSVFGWTMSEAESFPVLDAYAQAGGNFLDTADAYSAWVDGNAGGESETIIGNWMKARGNRDELIVATKFGQLGGVRASAVHAAADASLRRLQTDRIDLYYAHIDDPAVPLEETIGALSELVTAGKVRALGACGYSPGRLADALAICARNGLARYAAIQPLYNLLDRDEYEAGLQALCLREQIACIPYSGLARGFLTGKYRPGQQADSKRGAFGWTGEWDPRSRALLDALDSVARAHDTRPAAVAVAWLAAQPGVLSPIVSARTAAQLEEALRGRDVDLTAAELRQLIDAGKTQDAVA
jgi:aryl-alcohol dehydrogenase-like predicted oxidoreductase